MGIPGLTTFVNNHSDIYLEYYELHNTYLVIDGNNVCYSIYNSYTKSNCAFGGDYDNYAQCVTKFFDDLLKCNVTPLVILDGGTEDKKLRTIIQRTRERINAACSFCPLSQENAKSIPLLLKEIFRDVMREKNIRHVQCLFEADNDIASVAKILNCPVLSYDSDFYIYGALFIPFNSLDTNVKKNPNGNGYMKCCKIYKVENLLKSFKGLNQTMLPLAAVLLGNDYVKYKIFKNFFRHLKLRGASNKKRNHRQCCIERTLIWLSKHTLNNAITEVLSRLIKPIRLKILDLIEVNINSYLNISTEILIPLGFPTTRVNINHLNRNFKFNGDINTLAYIEEGCKEESSEKEEEDDEIEITDIFDEFKSMSKNAAVINLPLWFKNEILMSEYPSYFMDLIVRCSYICPVQVEDCSYPSSVMASLKILSVIFGILKSPIDDKCYMKYLVRNENRKMKWCTLEVTKIMNMCELPSLFNLKEIPLPIRSKILNNTLGITNMDCINELPPEWMLYVGCIKYWMYQQEYSTFHKYYLYSIFISMLFNIIDSKIGKYRNMHIFQNKYCQIIETIKQERKNDNYNSYTMDSTIIEAYNEIDHHDCVLAAPFFISHFKINKELYTNPKIFSRYTVHVFAEFQSCVRHAMHLNALLRYPYPHIKIANLFNGTLLYNLSNNFKTRRNIEQYINTILQTSPSLLRLFHIFLLKIKPMFSHVLQDEINPHRKHKKRRKRSKSNKNNSATSDSEYFSADDNLHDPHYDSNNRFSILNLV
ncbi:protein asteroid-like [Frieseomelitta varia]|uniref:protein asteroid-like n=1 Tax=Frieseomelitta varia TaxID=561572 RepID=UPI001CB6A54F|nr:protein asteroid-like [Frieseomelitta varia]XP_043512402.1 protein asteroid-like [Frieseomelitta varia]XP_043512403.1 protein asteroid-like [Frieseomelitta varia]XP_043512404.1 protein asteroid-like [Frieseomelitta varia]